MICEICGKEKRQSQFYIRPIKRKNVCLDCYKSGLALDYSESVETMTFLNEYSKFITKRNEAYVL